MKILLLCHYDPFNASMVTDHIDAFSKFSEHDVFVHKTLLSNQGSLEADLDLDLFDVIIVHYSIFIGIDAYLSQRSKKRLAAARGVKVVFLQDEYRFVQRSVEGIAAIKADVVFTCVPEESIKKVYNHPSLADVKFVNTLTGYITEGLTILQPIELKKRKYHVSYRGRRYPDWHGSMGREKYEIAAQFLRNTRGKGIKNNISTKERHRVYGAAWTRLIQNSRAVLGVESGASVFDFSGEISAKTETRRALLGRKGISYEALRDQYFAGLENTIDLAQVSPRVFEAMSLRTLCVLYEGNYSGLMEADVHYLSLKKNFSNIDDVVARLKDDVYVSEVIANAYYDIALNRELSYKSFISRFDSTIGQAGLSSGVLFARNGNDLDQINARFQALQEIEQSHSLTSKFSGSTRWLKKVGQNYLPRGMKARIRRLIK